MNNRKWVPSDIAGCFPDGERWSLLELNSRAGYYQEIGRVVKLNHGWQWGVCGPTNYQRFNSPQDAARALLQHLPDKEN